MILAGGGCAMMGDTLGARGSGSGAMSVWVLAGDPVSGSAGVTQVWPLTQFFPFLFMKTH